MAKNSELQEHFSAQAHKDKVCKSEEKMRESNVKKTIIFIFTNF